ncbi:MAG: hypothetical protein R2757_02245 [Draconibacterium sp.]
MIRSVLKILPGLSILIVLTGILFSVDAQEVNTVVEGAVSYISGENIYVRFINTDGIENGDTLFIVENENLVPGLVVQHHSSLSCLCSPVGEKTFNVSDKIFAKPKLKVAPPAANENVVQETKPEQDINEQVLTSANKKTKTTEGHQKVDGRLSVSSYSNFSNASSENMHRFRYTFSMDAQNISNSKFSAETYISFTHKLNEWDVVKENLNDALKIYSLALQYDFNSTASFWAGRKINPRIANVGAIDGIQFQKDWKHFFAGVAAGTRPDYMDYGFNPDLFEYGAYIGQNLKVENGFVQTSLAYFEQRNNSNIDRRFIYLQHNNSFFKNVNVFSSFEVDLYKLENGQPVNSLTLTGLYLSVRYRVTSRLSLFGSYDNRRNVIYYETFKNYADAVLQQASRQGLRFRINYRPLNYLNLGINAGTRFMKNDPRKTNTFNGYATYTRIPWVDASLTLSGNLMQTAYLNGQVYGARLNKDLIAGKLYTMLNYRWVEFDYASGSKLRQNIGEMDLSWQFNKKFYLSVNYEATFQESENFNRLYLNIRWKF